MLNKMKIMLIHIKIINMNKKNILQETFLFFAFLLLLHQSIFSSEIYVEGIIKDAKTGEPLPYANIQIVNSNWGTTSNIDGKILLVIFRMVT